MTPDQFRELECSGYRTEFRCLTESRAMAGGKRHGVRALVARQRQLAAEAAIRFDCGLADG